MNNRPTLGLAVFAGVLLAVLLPALSHATSSGRNGEIAFSSPVHGVSQVFTVKPDGTGLRQVTHGTTPAGQYGLSWSPDGRSLLYPVTDAKGMDVLVESRADGSDPTVVSAPCTGTCLGDDAAVYSPDGTKIAFERAFGPIVNDNASRVAIFTMNANGSDLTQLTQHSTPTTTEDHGPQWSPDGTKIAFTRVNTTARPRGESAIEVMNADGSNLRRLTPFRIGAAHPSWSPDGKRILFNTREDPVPNESANLFTMHADGAHRRALTNYTGGTLQAFPLAWSPDGTQVLFRRMAYSGTDTEVGGFYILDLRTKHVRRLTSVRITEDLAAAWGRAPG